MPLAVETRSLTRSFGKRRGEKPTVASSLIAGIVGRGGRLVTLSKIEPTLEDVFVSLVGHGIDAAE